MAGQSTLILIVDDEPDMCWALEHLFKNHGLVTQKALSGQEALNLMGQHRFTCAFLDAKLPDMDGLELARPVCDSLTRTSRSSWFPVSFTGMTSPSRTPSPGGLSSILSASPSSRKKFSGFWKPERKYFLIEVPKGIGWLP